MSTRSNFELECLFRDDMLPGCFVRDETKYVDPKTEAMYQGYVMGDSSRETQLKRFSSDRYISNAFQTNVKTLVAKEGLSLGALQEMKEFVFLAKAVLKTASELPG